MKKLIPFELALLLLGGLFFWNTWVFGWVNHGVAGYSQMSISELNVSGQPFALFFSITEWLSGLFLFVSAAGLMLAIRKGVFMLLALSLIGIVGILTIFDATHPVDCNQYQNPVCTVSMMSGRVSRDDKAHGTESIVTDYVTVALALTLIAWVLMGGIFGYEISRAQKVIVVLLGVGIILSLVVREKSIVFNSLAQRIWNTLVSFGFLYVAYKIDQLNLRKRSTISGLPSKRPNHLS